MSAKFLVPLCAAAMLLAACNHRDDNSETGRDTPGATSGDKAEGKPGDTSTTPGGTAGDASNTPPPDRPPPDPPK
jgi:hypothetical protein